jgi:hypothetical protein
LETVTLSSIQATRARIGRVPLVWIFRPGDSEDGFMLSHVSNARHGPPAAGATSIP